MEEIENYQKESREELRKHFLSGMIPTQKDFGNLIESVSNLKDDEQVRFGKKGLAIFPKSADENNIPKGTALEVYTKDPFKNNGEAPVWFLTVDEPGQTLYVKNARGKSVLSITQEKKINIFNSKDTPETAWTIEVDQANQDLYLKNETQKNTLSITQKNEVKIFNPNNNTNNPDWSFGVNESNQALFVKNEKGKNALSITQKNEMKIFNPNNNTNEPDWSFGVNESDQMLYVKNKKGENTLSVSQEKGINILKDIKINDEYEKKLTERSVLWSTTWRFLADEQHYNVPIDPITLSTTEQNDPYILYHIAIYHVAESALAYVSAGRNQYGKLILETSSSFFPTDKPEEGKKDEIGPCTLDLVDGNIKIGWQESPSNKNEFHLWMRNMKKKYTDKYVICTITKYLG